MTRRRAPPPRPHHWRRRPALSALAPTPGKDDDGLLTVLDVFRMRLDADLVVPSAYEAAKGKVCKAEGVVGFTRAFLIAGAAFTALGLAVVGYLVHALL